MCCMVRLQSLHAYAYACGICHSATETQLGQLHPSRELMNSMWSSPWIASVDHSAAPSQLDKTVAFDMLQFKQQTQLTEWRCDIYTCDMYTIFTSWHPLPAQDHQEHHLGACKNNETNQVMVSTRLLLLGLMCSTPGAREAPPKHGHMVCRPAATSLHRTCGCATWPPRMLLPAATHTLQVVDGASWHIVYNIPPHPNT